MPRALKLTIPAEPKWAPEAFVFVDPFALTGEEERLANTLFEKHIGAQTEVLEELTGLDIPVMRAREIIQSVLLVIAGISAHELRIPPGVFGAAACEALAAATAAVAVGSDIQGVA